MRDAVHLARRNGPTLRCPPSEGAIERHVVFPLANYWPPDRCRQATCSALTGTRAWEAWCFGKEGEAPQSTAPHPLLVSLRHARLLEPAAARRSNSSAEARSLETVIAERNKEIPAGKLKFSSACPLSWTMTSTEMRMPVGKGTTLR